MIYYVADNIVFLIWKVLNSKNLSIVSENPQMKINSFQKLNHGDLIHTWSYKGLRFKGYRCESDMPLYQWKSPLEPLQSSRFESKYVFFLNQQYLDLYSLKNSRSFCNPSIYSFLSCSHFKQINNQKKIPFKIKNEISMKMH